MSQGRGGHLRAGSGDKTGVRKRAITLTRGRQTLAFKLVGMSAVVTLIEGLDWAPHTPHAPPVHPGGECTTARGSHMCSRKSVARMVAEVYADLAVPTGVIGSAVRLGNQRLSDSRPWCAVRPNPVKRWQIHFYFCYLLLLACCSQLQAASLGSHIFYELAAAGCSQLFL